MQKILEWINNKKLLLFINIILLLPLIGVLSQFEINLLGDGSFLTYNISESVKQTLEKNGKVSTPLWLPIHSTGEWAIRLFMITLTCTPISIIFGWNTKRYRKLFGIYTFIYTVFHLLFFLSDHGFFGIFDELTFVIGMIATLIIIPLGITSNKWSMSKLRKNWVKLQRLAYPAAVISILHVVLIEGGAWQLYGYVILFGFILRFKTVKSFIKNLRTKKINPMPSVQ